MPKEQPIITWKKVLGIITSAGVVIAFIAAINAFDDRYATTKNLEAMETKLVKTLDDFKKEAAKERLQQRYITITDQLMQIKLLMYKYPDNPGIKNDYEKLNQELDNVRTKLENTK